MIWLLLSPKQQLALPVTSSSRLMLGSRLQPGSLLVLLSTWLILPLPPVVAQIVNRTIDDSAGDSQTGLRPTYSPSTGVWRDQTCPPCATCTTSHACAINPDVAQAFDGTYTAATYDPKLGPMSITMQFQGTAIYVFFILVNNAGAGVVSQTTANFALDGNSPSPFQHNPDMTTTAIEYNQLVFAQTNLKNTQHTLVISISGDAAAYVNFDYAIYTQDDGDPTSTPVGGSTSTSSSSTTSTTGGTTSRGPTTSETTGGSISTTGSSSSITLPSTSNNAPATTPSPTQSQSTSTNSAPQSAPTTKSRASSGLIAGSVVGGLAILALLAFLVFLIRRNKRHSERDEDAKPFPPPPHMSESVTTRNKPIANTSPFIDPPLPPPSTFSSQTKSSLSPSQPGAPIPPSEYSRQKGAIISSFSTAAGSSSTASDDVAAIRRARQTEIDERLRRARQAMTTFLASDASENGGRHPSTRRQRPPNGDSLGVEGEEEEEMSVSDMREQLRSMKEYIAHLEEQQRSAWAQGLTNDPPPGYSPATPSPANSARPAVLL